LAGKEFGQAVTVGRDAATHRLPSDGFEVFKLIRSPPPSFHYTVRSRSFQPIPVEGVPPRSPNLDFGRSFRECGTAHEPPRKVEHYQPNIKTHMSYLNEFEQELKSKLNSAEGEEAIIRWISEKVLESYRNGIKAGQKGTQVIRDGKSRRKGSFTEAK
jgi:hypothetical protein